MLQNQVFQFRIRVFCLSNPNLLSQNSFLSGIDVKQTNRNPTNSHLTTALAKQSMSKFECPGELRVVRPGCGPGIPVGPTIEGRL
jgi:hypothetical protein